MTIKVIQLNLWKGTYLDAAVAWLRQERPDLLTLQEVTGGGENRWPDQTVDCFQHLRQELGMDGALAKEYRVAGTPAAYSGSAVFTRGSVRSSRTLWLEPYREVSADHAARHYPDFPRCLLDCVLRLSGLTIHALCLHGAWTAAPVDTPLKLRHARAIARELERLGGEPFIFGGDFNVPPQTEVIRTIAAQASSAAAASGGAITRTTHPTIHKTAARLPAGLLVDDIFFSRHFRVLAAEAPAVAISDHLPVRAELAYRHIG